MSLRTSLVTCTGVCFLAFALSQSTKSSDSKIVLDTPSQSIVADGEAAQVSLAAVPETITAQVLQGYGKLPLSFEANQGQSDRRVKFLSRGSSYTLFLTPTEAVLALKKADAPARKEAKPSFSRRSGPAGGPVRTADTALIIKMVGANAAPEAEGVGQLPGKVNYFLGNDPKNWRADVPTYSTVRFHDVYPGIDLLYHGNPRQLESDFVVAAGADPNEILLSIRGADKLEVDARGDLVMHAGGGEVHQQKPFIYQEVNGVRQEIPGNYLLYDRNQVGFQIGAYDATRSLIIDPVLVYSTYLGGGGEDRGTSIAVDSFGNAYVTGLTFSINFPTTTGVFQTPFAGGDDVFVTKLNAAGSALIYSTYLGGSSVDEGYAIAVDSSSNAYVTGLTSSTDFPTTTGAFQMTSGRGGGDAFVTKLNATGSALLYSTYLGGSDLDEGTGISVDSSGNAYVAGVTYSTDLPTTTEAFQTTIGGGDDAFVAKLNATGSALLYSTYLGGSGFDVGRGIAVDSSGNCYVTGDTLSTNFPTTTGAFQTTSGGGVSDEAFVTKLNATGSALLYSTYLGSSSEGTGIAVDSFGNAYMTGLTESANFPTTTGAFQTTFGGIVDAFATKLNATGSALVYSTYLGGSSTDEGFAIGVDASGNAYVTDITVSTNFPTTTDAFQATFGGGDDAFVTKLNTTGSALVYSTYLGGSNVDFGNGIGVDASGNAYIIGSTFSANFPTTTGAIQTTFSGGSSDAFISKFSFSVLFSCFSGGLELDRNQKDFHLETTLTLGPGGSINPLTEPVTLTIGTYSVTIPAVSFVKHDEGDRFEGVINGVRLEVLIRHRRCDKNQNHGDVESLHDNEPAKCACEADSYTFLANGKDATLKGITNPVTVTISVGSNSGTTEINAKFKR
jgi:hypothetical protein